MRTKHLRNNYLTFFEVLQLVICKLHINLIWFKLDILWYILKYIGFWVALLNHLRDHTLTEGHFILCLCTFLLWCLSVINRIFQCDALLLSGNLLLLLHLKFLMNLLCKLNIEFCRVLLRDSRRPWFLDWILVWLIGSSWASSVTGHWWDVVNSHILFLREWWLPSKVRRNRLIQWLFP